MEKISISNLSVDENLVKFINDEAIPGTNVNSKKFWESFSEVVNKLAPKNKSLIQKRAEIQKKIDEWHISKKESIFDKKEYINFLKSIGYIVEEKSPGIPKKLVKSKCPTHRQSTPSIEAICLTFSKPCFVSI